KSNAETQSGEDEGHGSRKDHPGKQHVRANSEHARRADQELRRACDSRGSVDDNRKKGAESDQEECRAVANSKEDHCKGDPRRDRDGTQDLYNRIDEIGYHAKPSDETTDQNAAGSSEQEADRHTVKAIACVHE